MKIKLILVLHEKSALQCHNQYVLNAQERKTSISKHYDERRSWNLLLSLGLDQQQLPLVPIS